MTDHASPPRLRARGDTLGLRLALTFLAVALAAVALVAGLTAAFAAADVSALATRQQTELTSAIAVAAGAAWDRASSWADHINIAATKNPRSNSMSKRHVEEANRESARTGDGQRGPVVADHDAVSA